MTTSPTQGERAQTEALRPKFGDLLRNTMASESNPRRDAYFIREVHRSGGGVNPGRWFEMTDGKGETWLSNPQNMVPTPPAQPAAPQGVAYAELPDDFPKTVAELEFLLDVARNCGQHMERADRLAASNGQAPATQQAGEVHPRHPVVVKWRDNGIEACAGIADAYGCHDAARDMRAMLTNSQEVAAQKPVARIEGIDEYGPRIEWLKHWVDVGVGARFYTAPQPPTAQAAPAPVLHLVHSAFAEVAMAFPGAYALHKVQIADTAVREALAAPAAGAVAGMPPGVSALMCVISSLRDTAHFSDEEGELTDELRTLRDWAMTQAAAPTPATQADSQAAPQGETNVQLDTDSNTAAPGQQRDVAGSVALGQPMGNGPDQVAGYLGAQGDKLLTVAERNIRSFLRSAVFKSESDREAALSCVDVLRDAARAPADSVLEDAARYRHLRDCNSGSLAVMQITGTGEDDWCILTEDDADAAIDAAMNKGGAA